MKHPALIGFFQALGVVAYVTLVAFLMQSASQTLNSVEDMIWAPVVFITLFSASALMCGLITLGYPVKLIWGEKQVARGLGVVVYTAAFLVAFVLSVFGLAAVL